jgi:hypothetical protein
VPQRLNAALDIMFNLVAKIRDWWNRPPAPSPVFSDEIDLSKIEGFLPTGFDSFIQILNDEETPMAVVVEALEEVFALKRNTATQLMLKIHLEGGILIGMSSAEEAGLKELEINSLLSVMPGRLRVRKIVLTDDLTMQSTRRRNRLFAQSGQYCRRGLLRR